MNPEKRKKRHNRKAKAGRVESNKSYPYYERLMRGEYELTEKGRRLLGL